MKALTLLLIINFFISSVEAKDFGTEGHTYEIIEEDILKFIEKQLAKADLQKLNQEMKNRTTEYVEQPTAVAGITKAKQDKTFYYDPTYILQNDIRNHEGKLIHKAGTRVNPLVYLPLTEDLIFIDGDDKEQVTLALNHRKVKDGKIKIILVKGSPLELQREQKVWIYFDQGGVITHKLGITEIPAIVEQESLKLKISVRGNL